MLRLSRSQTGSLSWGDSVTRQLSTSWPPRGKRLEGKVCIVTGAGSRGPGIGNGRAIAIIFAREGAHVVLVDRQRDRAQETLTSFDDDERGRARFVEADVSIDDDCARIVGQTMNAYDRIDVVVNNVGIAGPAGNAVDVDMNDWERAMRVNVGSMVLMAKHAVPFMAARGSGSIVNISSIAGLLGGFPSLFYPVSKGSLLPLTRVMASQHGSQGIRVNCVAPGLVYTPMVAARGMSPETRENRRLAGALKSEGDAWDVAYAVLYLASEEARWITGVFIPVDGGLALGGRSNDGT
ncbi:MAG TPA: oxidoreductase [Chloroflexi bacterium]|nr:oxidoreductase [Chloroflexota bacterium]